jgi:Lanthionine synthetase C-like protein
MDSHHVDKEIHQNISYSLPDGRIEELLNLLKSYTEGQKDLKIEIYVKQQIKLLIGHIQEVEYTLQPTMSHFPVELNPHTGEKNYTHEFSWSRGDLPILVLLYQADKAFRNDEYSFIAHTVGSIVAKRTQIEPINQNPYLRHGTAGIAQCFYTLYLLSSKSFYFEAYQSWIIETYRYLALGYSGFLSDDFLDSMEGVKMVLNNPNNLIKQLLL